MRAEPIRRLLRRQVLVTLVFLSACRTDGGKPADKLESAAGERSSTYDYSVLREWRPNESPNGYGAEILLESDIESLSEADVLSFVRTLAGNHDPVQINVYTSRTAYDQERSGRYGAEYKSGFLLFYVKNGTGQGAYRGFNEIRWMQEIGRFSSRFGQKTLME